MKILYVDKSEALQRSKSINSINITNQIYNLLKTYNQAF